MEEKEQDVEPKPPLTWLGVEGSSPPYPKSIHVEEGDTTRNTGRA